MSTGGRLPRTVMDPLHAVGHPGQLQDRLRDPVLGPPRLLPPAVTDKQVPPAAVLWCLRLASIVISPCLVPVKTLRGVLY